MSFESCAALVERADPDRFAALMSAPVAVRRVCFPLYAFNIEVSRAPWVTKEPMIAEMRLQWWRDALEEIGQGRGRRHAVVDALGPVLDSRAADDLDALVAARRWDVYTDAFEDMAAFDGYIEDTSGLLLWTAVRLCGQVSEETRTDVLRYGFGVGVANWLRAIPQLQDRGRIPLVDGTPQGARDLAERALSDMKHAKSNLKHVSAPARAVLRSGWRAEATLRAARDIPERVIEGQLDESPFARKLRLMMLSARGAF
jgi:phytoene/squalene synthetase